MSGSSGRWLGASSRVSLDDSRESSWSSVVTSLSLDMGNMSIWWAPMAAGVTTSSSSSMVSTNTSGACVGPKTVGLSEASRMVSSGILSLIVARVSGRS